VGAGRSEELRLESPAAGRALIRWGGGGLGQGWRWRLLDASCRNLAVNGCEAGCETETKRPVTWTRCCQRHVTIKQVALRVNWP
jgi:hypothetical protein